MRITGLCKGYNDVHFEKRMLYIVIYRSIKQSNIHVLDTFKLNLVFEIVIISSISMVTF